MHTHTFMKTTHASVGKSDYTEELKIDLPSNTY